MDDYSLPDEDENFSAVAEGLGPRDTDIVLQTKTVAAKYSIMHLNFFWRDVCFSDASQDCRNQINLLRTVIIDTTKPWIFRQDFFLFILFFLFFSLWQVRFSETFAAELRPDVEGSDLNFNS